MGPAKLQKAEKLGVTILSEQQFIELIGGDSAPTAEPTAEVKPATAEPKQGTLF